MRNIFVFLIFLLAFEACKKDNDDTFDYSTISKQYFPYKKGSVLIFKVDSTIYDNFKDSVFRSTIYRRYIIDSLNNSIETRTLFRVSVAEADSSNGPWTHKRVDQWALTRDYFETQENNIRFVHLSFPPNYESTWNVNQFTNLQNEPRYYLEINDTFKLDDIIFTDVLKTENEPKVNQVVNIQHYEVFAKNFGCVYKKISNIETQLNEPQGYITEAKLYEYKY